VTALHLLFHDEHLFVVYKPAGLHSVRLAEGGGRSVADLLLERYPHLAQTAKSSDDAGLISRLDQHTSGLIVGAFSAALWESLYQASLEGLVRKTYAALVQGNLSTDTSCSSYIGSPNRGARKVKVYEKRPAKSARALPGTTFFSPLSYDSNRNISLITAEASPARRHQIRAHASHVGHPLLGDSLYGSTLAVAGLTSSLRSFFLHSWKVSLCHPVTAEPLTFESPLEAELVWSGQPPL
jgi:23S rRNA-/tRNA-specific pseudouridylate synthase